MAGSKPHIILIGGDGHPSGVPRHIGDLIRALRGCARISVVSEPDKGGYADMAKLGVRHVVLPGLASRLSPGSLRQGRIALRDFLTNEPADLVWFHARLPVILGRRLLVTGDWQPNPETRVALTYHGLPFGRGHRQSAALLSRRIERQLLSRCPPIDLVFLTEAQKHRMANVMGSILTRHRTHILGNTSSLGLAPGSMPSLAGGRHLVMTGRKGWQKNYDAALRLMAYLPEDITLSLCGTGTDSTSFQSRARRLAGDGAARLRLLGPLADIRPVLASADGYMLTSRYEGLPIGALEASEYGLPLVLSDFEGVETLLQTHPMSIRLIGSMTTQAQSVDALLNRYLADRARNAAAIRAKWMAHWSPEHFDRAARNLVATWFGSA